MEAIKNQINKTIQKYSDMIEGFKKEEEKYFVAFFDSVTLEEIDINREKEDTLIKLRNRYEEVVLDFKKLLNYIELTEDYEFYNYCKEVGTEELPI